MSSSERMTNIKPSVHLTYIVYGAYGATPADVVFLPCKHLEFCRGCWLNGSNESICPFCRCKVEDRIKSNRYIPGIYKIDETDMLKKSANEAKY